jgi:hypothetical protein
MLMVVTTRPPFTYAFTTSLQYISILEKLYFLLFHVESNRFLALLKFLSCYYWCGVIVAGGSARRECKLLLLLLREGAYVLTLLPTNRLGSKESGGAYKIETSFEALSLFSLSCSRSLFETVE